MMRNAWRLTWTIATLVVVETLVCAVAALPVAVVWWWAVAHWAADPVALVLLLSIGAVPSYVAFALALIVVSPVVVRAVGWRTPRDVEMRIAELGWPLLTWIRYMAAIHVVRLVAGALFRGSPVWTFHLRLSGARIGRRSYVNSLALSDYNLLEFGDDVVVGAGAHIAGHTVEGGIVKTAPVRLGSRVTIGLCAIVEIGVTVGGNTQIGALSFVPKHATLEPGAIYAGIPARKVPAPLTVSRNRAANPADSAITLP